VGEEAVAPALALAQEAAVVAALVPALAAAEEAPALATAWVKVKALAAVAAAAASRHPRCDRPRC
jgi:hypothetical protein